MENIPHLYLHGRVSMFWVLFIMSLAGGFAAYAARRSANRVLVRVRKNGRNV